MAEAEHEESELASTSAAAGSAALELEPDEPAAPSSSSPGPSTASASQASGSGDGPSKRDESTCVICFGATVTHCFIPCGHLCVCEGCADSVMKRAPKCPICSADVMMTTKIYVHSA